jgi:hydroxylamine dehydrogenase
MKKSAWLIMFFFLGFFSVVKVENPQAASPVSENTEACLGCHATVTPGIVYDWRRGNHSTVTPEEALKKGPKAKKVSSEKIPDKLRKRSLGALSVTL